MEKQRDKFAKRLQRKTEKLTGPPVDDMGEPVGDLSEPDLSEPKDDLEQQPGAVSMPAEWGPHSPPFFRRRGIPGLQGWRM